MNNTNTIENIETTNSSSVDEVLNQIESEEISNEEILNTIIAKNEKKVPKVKTEKSVKKAPAKKSKKTDKTPAEIKTEEVEVIANEVIEPITEILETPVIETQEVAHEISTETPVIEEVITTEVAKETKVKKEPKVKIVIDPSQITIPANVTRDIKKSCTIFKSDKRKAALKGSMIEFSVAAENLDSRLHVLSAEEIKSAHLGTMKAILRNIKGNDDLQTIINAYFA